jgi:acetolactate synthase-1/2/3 large subunit
MELVMNELVRVDGAEVYVTATGQGDELIVFLHPIGGDHSFWQLQIAALATNYRCLAADFRGHNRSTTALPYSETVSIAAFAADTIALIHREGFQKAHLVGLSMGGVVALEIFRREPQILQSLTLANTWAFHPDANARIEFIETQLAQMSQAESAAMLVPGLFAPTTDPAIIAHTVAVEAAKNKEVFLASWRSMFTCDYRDLLPRIDVPLLLLGGSLDQITPTNPLLTTIQSLVATAQLHDIIGAGHFSNLDCPHEFNRCLNTHLQRARALQPVRTLLPPVQTQPLDADNVAQALVQMLSRRGIEYFFANSGTDFTPIIDALARYSDAADFRLKTIQVPHENTAIAMAHGYYLLSRRPQAVMAHVNVGTANMGLGIINAARARIPMLVLAGRTPWYEDTIEGCRTNFVQWGQDTYDQGAYFREFTKWDYELRGAHNLETVVDRALAISQSEPAGPVYLTLPKEVLCQPVTNSLSHLPSRHQPNSLTEASDSSIARAVEMIAAAQKPVIITAEMGRYPQGIETLVQFAQRFAIPVIEHGKRNFCNFPTEHPLHLGFDPVAAVETADLIVALECPVPWIPAHTRRSNPPPVLQIAADPLFQDLPMRSFPLDATLAGHPVQTLHKLIIALSNKNLDSAVLTARYQHCQTQHTAQFAAARQQAADDALKPTITKRYLSYCLGQLVDDNVIIFNEYNLDPNLVPRRVAHSWFENSVASGLGWALGAALGAQLANPDLTMLATLGDGSYLFNTPLSAHYVAGAYHLPIMIVVFNDAAWSTIKKSYLGTSPNGWATKKGTFPLCDFEFSVHFEKLAESCGGVGLVARAPNELSQILHQGLKIVRQQRRHVLVNVICERDV